MNVAAHKIREVSEACQINDLDHHRPGYAYRVRVSEACQINDLDHLNEAITL